MGYASIYENYLLIEIKNGIIGKKREYNAEEYIKFRDKQFEAFKKTDEYIEEKARNDLNLIKPGEKVYVVKSTEDGVSGNVLSEADVAPSESKETVEGAEENKDENWYSWYRLFFDN